MEHIYNSIAKMQAAEKELSADLEKFDGCFDDITATEEQEESARLYWQREKIRRTLRRIESICNTFEQFYLSELA